MRRLAIILALLSAGVAHAQSVPGSDVYLGGIPGKGESLPPVLDLSLSEALSRGLSHNLGLRLAEDSVTLARGSRWKALADLLPSLVAQGTATRQKIDLAVFGITIPGVPSLVGPFNVFDGRVAVTSEVLNLKALHSLRAEGDHLESARQSRKDAEGLVILVCGSLYLQTISAESRIEEATAQLETAKALYELAADKKAAGSAPGIDVLRAEVQLRSREQQLIVAENEFAKAKLTLARAIGLPLGQEYRLKDKVLYAELPSLPLVAAQERAYRDRADWKAGLAELRAAEERRRAASAEYLPSVAVEADIGKIGQTFSTLETTYTLVGKLRVPLFEGGKTYGKVLEAESRLAAQRDLLADLKIRIDLEVRTAMLDLQATASRVKVAEDAMALAREQLQQAQDRFSAGVAGNLEVVQAQESVAVAAENRITSLYDYNFAKATLARALGAADMAYGEFVKGDR